MKPRIGVLPVVIAALGGATSCGEILKTGQLMASLRLRLVVLAEVAARSRSVLIRLIGRIRRITIAPNTKPRIGVLPVVNPALGGATSCGERLMTGQLMASL